MGKKENKKKQRAIYLDDDTYDRAVKKGNQDKRKFTNYVEVLIIKDIVK